MYPKSFLSLPLSLLAALGLSYGCKVVPPEQVFWKWFENNEAALLAVRDGREKILSELTLQIRKIDPKLVYEFGPEENGRREFTISADGMRDSFPAVETLYAAAPPLPRWKLLKFRQRREPVDISYQGVRVMAKSVRVGVTPAGDKVDIIVFIPGYTQAAQNTYMSIAFLMLDQSLGEYDVETFLGSVDVRPKAPPSEQTYSLDELPRIIDRTFIH
jgi:hypothetical protein